MRRPRRASKLPEPSVGVESNFEGEEIVEARVEMQPSVDMAGVEGVTPTAEPRATSCSGRQQTSVEATRETRPMMTEGIQPNHGGRSGSRRISIMRATLKRKRKVLAPKKKQQMMHQMQYPKEQK